MHINVTDFRTFHLFSLREPWKLIFPDKRQISNFCKLISDYFLEPLTILKVISESCNLFSKKPQRFYGSFFSHTTTGYLTDYCVLCDNYNIKVLFAHLRKCWVNGGLWSNSWVKNLPVRPLAPRRKTPGQLYPAFRPPGQGQKFWIIFIIRI